MDYSLVNHNYGYQFTTADAFYSLATGFTGATFAYRHYQLSSGNMGHKVLTAIECVPILGGIVALIERIVYAIFGRFSPMKKMRDNAVRAVEEHGKISNAYASVSKAVPDMNEFGKEESAQLQFTCGNIYERSEIVEERRYVIDNQKNRSLAKLYHFL